MPTFAVTNNFVSGTDAIADDVDTNFSDLVTPLNQLDAGTATWANCKVSATVANPTDITSSASTTELSINNSAADGDPIVSFELSTVSKATMGIDDSDSDKFKIAHASSLGTVSTDDFIMSTSTGAIAIRGTATNDDAAAGFVGELLSQSRIRSARTAASTGTALNVTATALTLTAGDWDLQGCVVFEAAGATSISQRVASISTTTATQAPDDSIGVPDSTGRVKNDYSHTALVGQTLYVAPLPRSRVTITGSTIYYLVATATFTVSTMEVYGSITARRVR